MTSKLTFSERIGLLRALVIAGLWTLWAKPLSKDGFGKLGSALKALWAGLDPDELSQVADQRLNLGCRQCPIFYAPMQTCGSPLHPDYRNLGCYCFMLVAVRIKWKQCWMDEQFPAPHDHHGWRKLNLENA